MLTCTRYLSESTGRSHYYQQITQLTLHLKQVEVWLDKAEQHANARKFDVNLLVNARLAPDQKPFSYQIQSACDYVKGAAAWLSGQALPKHPDTEQTFEELRARIRKAAAFAEGVKEAEYDGASERKVSFSWAPGKVMNGRDYLLQMVIPNAYFHLTTGYSILRHNGVDVGKMDFLGGVTLNEA